jgi:hypothetical protein
MPAARFDGCLKAEAWLIDAFLSFNGISQKLQLGDVRKMM